MVPVLLAIWGGVCDRSSHHDDDVFVMLESLASFYDAMNANSYFLPEPVQRKVLDCVNEISIRYRHRSAEARLLEQNRWREVPEFHYVWHIALQAATRVKNSYLMQTSQATVFLSNCRAGGAWQWALWGDEIQLEAVRNAVGALQEVMKDPFLGQFIGVGIEKPKDSTESAKFEVDCERLTSEVKPLIDNLGAEIAKLKRMHSARSK